LDSDSEIQNAFFTSLRNMGN